MLDNQNRISIQNFGVEREVSEVYFYFEQGEELFYISKEKIPGGFIIGIEKQENEMVKLPEKVMEVYQTKDIFFIPKGDRGYLIPIRKD